MTPEERRRRRLDRLIAAWNKDSAAMHKAMKPTDDHEPDELDELDEPHA